MFQARNFQHDNQKAVIGSARMAKAITQLPNGRYEIIMVFAKSTRLEFYWIFQARTPRSPIRTWKFMGTAVRDLPQYYSDFGSFVTHCARLRGATVLSVRMPRKRRLAVLQRGTEHESIYSDWNPQEQSSSTDRLRQKSINGRRGKLLWLAR
ncbi:MAG TPA: hypothetical protein VJ785_01045 [Anaerolineales bacterium]|nr:hypothetical protein [Anaerolineales bacterium]